MITIQDVVSFLKEYGFGPLEIIAVAALLFIRDRYSSIRAFLRWVGEAKYPLVAATVIIIAMATSVLAKCISPGSPEVVIRHTGLTLLLFGTATVIWGATKARNDFKLPSLRHQALLWLKRCPWLPRRGVARLEGVGACIGLADKLDAYGIRGVGSNPTIESLAEALIENVKGLHERISGLKNELDGEIREINRTIEGVDRARKEEARDIRKELLETATGGLHISVIGAIWLIVGTVLGTAAPELAKML